MNPDPAMLTLVSTGLDAAVPVKLQAVTVTSVRVPLHVAVTVIEVVDAAMA